MSEPYEELTKHTPEDEWLPNIQCWLFTNYPPIGVYPYAVAAEDVDHVEMMCTAFADAVINGNLHGHFVTYVLANDFHKAVGSADATNVKYLWLYDRFLYNMLPSRR